MAPAKYPLAERGVRIVSGKNLDSMGADSNGAGKTTLVMAPLWALTGTILTYQCIVSHVQKHWSHVIFWLGFLVFFIEILSLGSS